MKFHLAAWLVFLLLPHFKIFRFHYCTKCLHLSYPKSGSTSINSGISKEAFSIQHVTVVDAIESIKRFGPGFFLAKTGIESAFRLILVYPDEYELLGMKWEEKYYYDKVLPIWPT